MQEPTQMVRKWPKNEIKWNSIWSNWSMCICNWLFLMLANAWKEITQTIWIYTYFFFTTHSLINAECVLIPFEMVWIIESFFCSFVCSFVIKCKIKCLLYKICVQCTTYVSWKMHFTFWIKWPEKLLMLSINLKFNQEY